MQLNSWPRRSREELGIDAVAAWQRCSYSCPVHALQVLPVPPKEHAPVDCAHPGRRAAFMCRRVHGCVLVCGRGLRPEYQGDVERVHTMCRHTDAIASLGKVEEHAVTRRLVRLDAHDTDAHIVVVRQPVTLYVQTHICPPMLVLRAVASVCVERELARVNDRSIGDDEYSVHIKSPDVLGLEEYILVVAFAPAPIARRQRYRAICQRVDSDHLWKGTVWAVRPVQVVVH
eukprot:scaffold1839_cov382-Prasinococcus_capsulatus_cf.AAC.44